MKARIIKYMLLLVIPFALYATEFRILTYNVLYFFLPDSFDSERLMYLTDAVSETAPQIIALQEVITAEASDSLLSSFRTFNPEYERSNFINGPSSDNILIYDSTLVTLLSQNQIPTDLRDISEYIVLIDSVELRIYSCHLKAGEDYDAERFAEAAILREYLNTLPSGTEFIICGDMNFYGSYESAYQKFVGDEVIDIGRASDPLDDTGFWQEFSDSGNWHSNPRFAYLHTQSTRTRSFGGGAIGGLDDRFDFIFVSYNINNAAGIEYIEGSYTAFGNDGFHLNDSINALPNAAVTPEIANALHCASDHLPVYADFNVIPLSISGSVKAKLIEMKIDAIPNPFNSSVAIAIDVGAYNYTLSIEIYDLRGTLRLRSVPGAPRSLSGGCRTEARQVETTDIRTFIWTPAQTIESGLYLVKVRMDNGRTATKRVVYLK